MTDHECAMINDFAVRSFRDTADRDYITARLAYKAKLFAQFHWSAQQAIEKYLKAILLFSRIDSRKIGHDLEAALGLTSELPYRIEISAMSKKFVVKLNEIGRFRYFEVPYDYSHLQLLTLDQAVWEIRRYCKVLDYTIVKPDGSILQALPIELKRIQASENFPAHKFHLTNGELERILGDKKHPARAGLIWNNFRFGGRARKTIRIQPHWGSSNSPLSLNPQLLNKLEHLVHIPWDVKIAYREDIRELEELNRVQGSVK